MKHKKQAYELIEAICTINEKVWGNYAGSYDDHKEAAYQIEEAMEGFDNLDKLGSIFGFDSELLNRKASPKELSRSIVSIINTNKIPIEDVDRFDKALDAIYFAIGSMHKLGLTPAQIVDGLQIVHVANSQKSGAKDSNGKVIKASNFQPPEKQLQTILDKRSAA